MRKLSLLTSILLALIGSSVSARILNVPEQFPTIQAGIDSSANGDTVLVAPGTYYERIRILHSIVLASQFIINHDPSIINSTIIDANLGGRVISISDCEDTIMTVSGFTIQNGRNDYGGGVYCYRSNPIIANNIIVNNSYTRGPSPGIGGGIYCLDSRPRIENCAIISNYSIIAAAVYASRCYCLITNCTINRNFGSGELIGGDSIFITNTIISGNDYLYSLFSGNIDVRYSLIEEGWDGIGNIDADPLFLDPINLNYNICSLSPCINSGDPNIMDPDSSISDIGIYFPYHSICPVFNTLYVSPTGLDSLGRGTHESPLRTIQYAINSSLPLDSIIVEPGTYFENLLIDSKNIVLLSTFFNMQDSLVIDNTIINDSTNKDVISIYHCDSNMTLGGFTISDGVNGLNLSHTEAVITHNIISNNASSFNNPLAAIRCYDSNVCISNNEIQENRGIGIFCISCSPIITGNVIKDNGGSGIYGYRSNAIVLGNIINNNRGSGDYYSYLGGGIAALESYFTIIGNSICNNIARAGGGIASNGYGVLISNNIICDNSAELNGGGLFIRSTTPVLMTNNTICFNEAGTIGGGLDIAVNFRMINSIVWNNGANSDSQLAVYNSQYEITYSDIQGGRPGDGNINTYPIFRNSFYGNYLLQSPQCGYLFLSPCIDAGHPGITDSLLDCQWGLGTERSDMGAYGGGILSQVGIEKSPPSLPLTFSLSQNYPNPFNPATTLKYDLPSPCRVRIDIYDILGRRVATLSDEEQVAGAHQAIWNASDKSSGIYFYRIQAGEFVETKKMMLMK